MFLEALKNRRSSDSEIWWFFVYLKETKVRKVSFDRRCFPIFHFVNKVPCISKYLEALNLDLKLSQSPGQL